VTDNSKEQAALQIAVWNFLCTRHHLGKEGWEKVFKDSGVKNPSPILTGAFIKAVVASVAFNVPDYNEIVIDGATIKGALNLTHEVLRSGLAIRNSTFLGPVTLNFLRSGYDVDFTNSSFCEPIEAQWMRIDGSLYFGKSASLDGESTSSCQIQNEPGNTEKRNAFIRSIDLTKSNIIGELSIGNAYIDKDANFTSITLGRLLQISKSSLLSLSLADAALGQLELVDSNVRSTGPLQADGISVTHAVYLSRSHFGGLVGMAAARIKADLSVRGAIFDSGLDLSLSKIDGDLLLGSSLQDSFTTWNHLKDRPHAVLSLDHAEVGFIHAPLKAWPEKGNLKVNGFHFAGFWRPLFHDTDEPDDFDCDESLVAHPWGSWFSSIASHLFGRNPKHKTCYYPGWFAKIDYSPSIIDWLRQKQKGAGNEPLANKIGILNKNHERNSAWADGRLLDWLGLALSGLFIGYGYNPWLSGLWAFIFLCIGAFVFWTTAAARRRTSDPPHKPFNPFLFSFDLLLPFIQLRKGHHELYIQEDVQRWYFYFHRIMGYVLGLFLIGALSGLTK